MWPLEKYPVELMRNVYIPLIISAQPAQISPAFTVRLHHHYIKVVASGFNVRLHLQEYTAYAQP